MQLLKIKGKYSGTKLGALNGWGLPDYFPFVLFRTFRSWYLKLLSAIKRNIVLLSSVQTLSLTASF